MTLDELLALLPTGPGAASLPANGTPGCPRYVSEGLDRFVAPEVRLESGSASDSQIVLISAPGAVGKSTLAREIALAKSVPLWDLASDGPVAKHTAMGALTQSFGVTIVSQAISALTSGKMFLVVDALDEARIKANEASFEAFIRDIAGIARSSSHVSFVLLGRTQAAELTWMILEEEGVKSALLEIEPFDRAHAELYIDQHILTTAPKAVTAIATHRESFEKARNTIFDRLVESIDRSPVSPPSKTAAAFVGYAPVLDAISVLLAGTLNFAQLCSRLISETLTVTTGSSHKFRAIQLLARIVEDIIDREQSQKLVQNIRPALQTLASQFGWSDWERLYLPEEQLERLVARLGQRSLAVTIKGMPAQIHAAYEVQVASWLPEHPFLRDGTVAANAVFESYILARALATTGNARETAEAILQNERYKPSRLLADFYMLFKANDGSNRVPPEHIGILYDALASADTDAARVRMLVESPDDDDAENGAVADVEFEFVRSIEQEVEILDSYELTSFVNDRAHINFRKTLRDALIRVPCGVELGHGASEFRLGPNVTVQCKSLILDVQHLTVDTHSRRPDITEGAVLLEAQECISAVMARPTVRGGLQISWRGGNAYPWNEFYSPESGPSFRNSAVAAAYRRFRRIVLTLRSHSKGSLARYRHKIESQRVLQGALGEALLNQLRTDKVLQLDNKFYHWNPERAAALVGISWQDLRRRHTSELLTAYLESFLRSHSEFA